ncbi:MAG: STAS/SEC14 domain-containing protein [Acidimicrobiia bacterium]
MDRSSGSTLGFKVSGDVSKEDYAVLTPAVEAAVADTGSVNLLCDLTDFHWEKVSAWGSDLHFGHEYHDKIEKMAIVGNRKWQEYLTKIASPFYAKEAQYFDSDDDAWAWLEN